MQLYSVAYMHNSQSLSAHASNVFQREVIDSWCGAPTG